MAILRSFALPRSAKLLEMPEGPSSKLFLAFISGNDPITNEPWCPDVRAALPHIEDAFATADAPTAAMISVGQKPEYLSVWIEESTAIHRGVDLSILWVNAYLFRWKEPTNVYRRVWNVNNVPALVRYQRINGEVAESGRLIEGEILDQAKLQSFIS